MFKTKEIDTKIVVNENKQKDLGNALIDLLSSSKKNKKNRETVEVEVVEEKPKKKKKKKSKSLSEEFEVTMLTETIVIDDETSVEVEDSGLMDADDFIDQLEDDDLETIIYDQKKSYKKNKKSDGYIKQFAEEITLLYGLLEESNDFNQDLEKIYKNVLKNSRGFNKSTTDMINAIISVKNTKLSIIKEINSVKKNIADLSLKESRLNGNNDDSQNNVNAIAASYFNNIVKHGRNNFIEDVTTNRTNEIDQYIENIRVDEDTDSLNDELLLGLENESFRSEESNAYIKNETRDVTIKVQHEVSNGTWEFVAVDKDGYILDDYPLPSKDFVSPVKFSNDGMFLTDKFQRMYKVIEII